MNLIDNILSSLYAGDLTLVLNTDNIKVLSDTAMNLIHGSINDNELCKKVLLISNILYNNTDMSPLPLEDGVYDILFQKFANENANYSEVIGAPPIVFNNIGGMETSNSALCPFIEFDIDNMLYFDQINKSKEYEFRNPAISPFEDINYKNDDSYVSKRIKNTKHTNKELVGTLLKSKFVLSSQALERGVLNDDNVRVLERDFFQKHIEMGILRPERRFKVIMELKYDGISVEGDVSSIINSARSRGDANESVAADLSPILAGYPFRNALKVIPDDNIFGMKFEAIITKDNLKEYNNRKNKEYKNCRTAISGLFSSSDAYKYKDLITLIPLATSLDIPRLDEVEFMNKYYANEEYLRYAVAEGTYVEVLFQIKKFVEEAEMMRDALPFMYDGVVISYIDEDLIDALGRKNAINLYSEAIKFNPLKKQTIFRGYEFTVGQDGSITPMIMYDPVEFFGTIHPNSTGHSYKRFMELGLKYGDIIDVEYSHDVMPYVTKPYNSVNDNNLNEVIPFITHCPICGTELELSRSGKSIYCTNKDCDGRKLARMRNMLNKLNSKDFSEASLEKINKYTLKELLETTIEESLEIFTGDILPYKFIERMMELKTKPINDYKMVGSLGFTNLASSNWKSILKEYTLSEILEMNKEELLINLCNIKGIGNIKAETLIEELPYFMNDLTYINSMDNITISKYNNSELKIRFTGVRDASIVEIMSERGHDIGEGSVTKDTNILIVPDYNYSGSKVDKANKYGIRIIPISEFREEFNL